MKKSILIILGFLVLATTSSAVVVRKDIVQATLTRIVFSKIIKTNVDTGEKITSITVRLEGYLTDEDGATISDVNPEKEYEWTDLPQPWRDALRPIFKAMSKQFNIEFADEDVETFDITEIEVTTTTTTTVP